jgi:hypothetical protein
MGQDSERPEQTPVSKQKLHDFRSALLWTAVPIIVLSAISIGGSIARHVSAFGFFSSIAAERNEAYLSLTHRQCCCIVLLHQVLP